MLKYGEHWGCAKDAKALANLKKKFLKIQKPSCNDDCSHLLPFDVLWSHAGHTTSPSHHVTPSSGQSTLSGGRWWNFVWRYALFGCWWVWHFEPGAVSLQQQTWYMMSLMRSDNRIFLDELKQLNDHMIFFHFSKLCCQAWQSLDSNFVKEFILNLFQ